MDEAPFWISINGSRRVMLSCAPGGLEPLAVGHLIGEGWVDGAADIEMLAVHEGPGGAAGVSVHIAADRVEAAEALRDHVTRHGCGLRHFLDCGGNVPRVAHGATAREVTAVFRELFATADAAAPSGGVHAAALSDGAVLVAAAVDVARHCAVDRAIGGGVLAGHPRGGLGLVLTSRISAAMVLKAARAGVPWIASRSISTPLGHELAALTGVRVIEHAARRGRHGTGHDAARAEDRDRS